MDTKAHEKIVADFRNSQEAAKVRPEPAKPEEVKAAKKKSKTEPEPTPAPEPDVEPETDEGGSDPEVEDEVEPA